MRFIIVKKIVLIFLLSIFFALIFKPLQRNTFNFPLRDEEDNIITGLWIYNGKKLYSDIYFQRQPLPTIISGTYQYFTKPNSIYLLIKRHRDFIFFYSAIWLGFLVIRFGWPALFMGISLELIKFSLLGNLFLAESLIIYPIMYVIGLLYTIYNREKYFFIELVFFIFSLLFILFNRLHLFPFVLIMFLITLKHLSSKRRSALLIIISAALLFYLAVFFPFVSFKDQFSITIIDNILIFAPSEAKYGILYAISSILFLPFKLLFSTNSDFLIIAKIISLYYFATLFVLIRSNKVGLALMSYSFLIALNIRPGEFGVFSEGRRFLPWFAALLWIMVLNYQTILSLKLARGYKYFSSILVIFMFIFLILPFGLKELSLKSDPFNKWYIHYSSFFDYGQTINILSNQNDTVLAIPQQPLVYWQSNLNSSSPYFFTLDFMMKNSVMSKRVANNLQINPPNFLYLEGEKEFKYFKNLIFDSYIRIYKWGEPSYLYIHKSKFANLSDSEWSNVSSFGFSRPSLED